jgi:hypothetical protein
MTRSGKRKQASPPLEPPEVKKPRWEDLTPEMRTAIMKAIPSDDTITRTLAACVNDIADSAGVLLDRLKEPLPDQFSGPIPFLTEPLMNLARTRLWKLKELFDLLHPAPPPPALPTKSTADLGVQADLRPPAVRVSNYGAQTDPEALPPRPPLPPPRVLISSATQTAQAPARPSRVPKAPPPLPQKQPTYAEKARAAADPKNKLSPPARPVPGNSRARTPIRAPHITAAAPHTAILVWPTPPTLADRPTVIADLRRNEGAFSLPTISFRWTRRGNLAVTDTDHTECPLTESIRLAVVGATFMAGYTGSLAGLDIIPDGPWDEVVVHGVPAASSDSATLSRAVESSLRRHGRSAAVVQARPLKKKDHPANAPCSVKLAFVQAGIADLILQHGLVLDGFLCRVSLYRPRKHTPAAASAS